MLPTCFTKDNFKNFHSTICSERLKNLKNIDIQTAKSYLENKHKNNEKEAK